MTRFMSEGRRGALSLVLGLCLADSALTAEGQSAPDRIWDESLECPKPGSTIEVRRSLKLRSGCVLRRVTFIVSASHVTLDCDGAVLHGLQHRDIPAVYGAAYPLDDAPRNVAFFIANREGTPPVGNVTIRNCTVRNYLDGAQVALQLNRHTRQILRGTRNPEVVEARLRAAAPRDITFDRVRIEFPHKSGLFVNRYVQHVVFRGGAVTNAGNSAIYLNSGSGGHEIADSLFEGNGYSNYDDAERVRYPRRGVARRESIAVDSSSHNAIRRNRFRHNAAGGVFLYKNCWEHWQDPDQLPRTLHSSDNLIADNDFAGEKVGVWIASRQSRDLNGFECGDPLQFEEGMWLGTKRYYRDHAERTTVIGNRFEDIDRGVLVEDDAATILQNVFVGSAVQPITVGSPIRGGKLGRGVRGTRVIGNVFEDGSTCPIRNLYGARDGVFQGNSGRGRRSVPAC